MSYQAKHIQMASTETSVGHRLEPSWASASGSSLELHLELILPCFFDSFLVDRDVIIIIIFFKRSPRSAVFREESLEAVAWHIFDQRQSYKGV